jgi:hypothetical protein
MGLSYYSMMVDEYGIYIGGMQKCLEKSYSSATLYTTHPTWTTLEFNPGICNEKLMSNCLAYGVVYGKTC